MSTGPNNVLYNKAAGQMTVTTSGAANWTVHPKRFVDATVNSLPIAAVLPNDLPQAADFYPRRLAAEHPEGVAGRDFARRDDAEFENCSSVRTSTCVAAPRRG